MSDGQAAAQRSSGIHVRVLGMPVRMPWSGILGVVIIAWLWLPTFDRAGAGVVPAAIFAILLYGTILLHELAHGLTAKWTGNRVHGITLWILGGYTVYERGRLTAGKEALVAASGPAVTLALAAAFTVLGNAVADSAPPQVVLVLDALAWTNALLGFVNLLPGLPLDGGGVVHAAVWGLTRNERTGTVTAAWAGRVIAIVAVFVPLVLALIPGSPIDVMTAVVAAVFGVFVWSGATMALRRSALESKIPTLAAGNLTRRAVPVAPTDSVALAVKRMADSQAGAAVVMDGDRPVGIVNDSAVAATPVERRAWMAVSSVAATVDPSSGIDSRLTGHDLIRALQQAAAPAVLVRDAQGSIYGVLVIEDVERALA